MPTAAQDHHRDTDMSGPRLGERAVRFPITVRTPRLRSALRAIVDALKDLNLAEAARLVGELAARPSMEVGGDAADSRVSPTRRAKAIALVLLDLAKNGWEVTEDDGEYFLVAPTWSAGAAGLSPDEVRQEKERIRESMRARVREQLERPSTRRFIEEAEAAHHTADGPRSVLNLLADGRALAEALRARGANAVQPYLQAADGLAGTDAFTGLPLTDIFRYFRYFWSFPFGSTPGRSVPILIRDAGQPGHPVCGLLAVASAVPRLSVRDSALGWTAAWLEAQVLALSATPSTLRATMSALEQGVSRSPGDLRPATAWEDLAAALGVDGSSPDAIASALGRLPRATASQRLRRARERLVSALVAELERAIRAISFEDLGVTHEAALREPARANQKLLAVASRARARYLRSREVTAKASGFSRASVAIAAGEDYATLSRSPLFKKKRADQAAKLLAAWADLGRLRSDAAWDHLRALATDPSGQYTAGAAVARGLRTSLAHRQGRFLASQVADIIVCGAIPPYGPLLGGKLAALLALSREPARLFHERYRDAESEIASQMAGEAVVRPADLLALTTTSFYGVGSSQYERVRLTDTARWRFAGFSRGHGTLHFSEPTSEALMGLVEAETGRAMHTSTFGEGPSERLRKVRDGLARLGLQADSLLQHGAPRQVFVAELAPQATRPGAGAPRRPWRLAGPSADEAAAVWRARWLEPRLVRMPGIIEDVAAFSRAGALLSTRLSAEAPAPSANGVDL